MYGERSRFTMREKNGCVDRRKKDDSVEREGADLRGERI